LLHEFHRLKYICPDKTYGKKSATVKEEPDQEGQGDASGKKKGKRDKYKGGLVFDPERGLWDRYILVMDFNSLYPSIIQEFNIDFTTVEPVVGEDEVCFIFSSAMQGNHPGTLRTARKGFQNPLHRALLKVFFRVSSPPSSIVDARSRV